MTTFAVLTFPADEIALSATLQQLSECHFRVEENAFGDSNSSIPIWITGTEMEAIVDALEADDSVSAYTLTNENDDEWLFDLEFDENMLLPRHIIQEYGGTVQEAFGSDDEWTLHVRFPTRADLSAADDEFERYGITVTYESIEAVQDIDDTRMDDLTDQQREGLEKALEMGYFDVPRRADLEAVAAELDITHQALSERLRRAQDKLASRHLSKRSTSTQEESERREGSQPGPP